MWLLIKPEGESAQGASVVPLPEGTLVVGRDRACQVIVHAKRVSRAHVELLRVGDEVTFRDLGSTSGTYLNGAPAAAGALRPGDRLSLGLASVELASAFPAEREPPVRPEPRPLLATTPAVDWTPFGAFLEQLRRSSDPRDLLKRLLLGLVDIFGAERGFVLLRERQGARLVPVACHRVADQDELLAVSSTVYEQAIRDGAVVCVQDSQKDPRCATARSLATAGRPRSIICGPLVARGTTFGVIYVDQERVAQEFDRATLQLFENVTGLAAELLAADETRRSLLAARSHISALNTLAWEGERLILGPSIAARELQKLVQGAAGQDVSVLITGETGTGKEMVARALHRMSGRRDGPFVPVNCAALPREIIEAELFGVEKGAFTGATERRLGRFELASTGTLFLDEVGELPAEMQIKLLRVLQERTVTRLGGQQPTPVDFRLVCATNRDVEQAVEAGAIRRDFYYRINVFRVTLHALRERREDLDQLSDYFLQTFTQRFAKKISGFTAEARAVIRSYPWPGNIRELRNAIERAVVVEATDVIKPGSLPVGSTAIVAGQVSDALDRLLDTLPPSYEDAHDAFERAYLTRCLKAEAGNVSAAARRAGMTRYAIYRRLAKLGMAREGGEETP